MKKVIFKGFFLLALLAVVATMASGCKATVDAVAPTISDLNPEAYRNLYGNWSVSMMGQTVIYTFTAEGYTAASHVFVITGGITVSTNATGNTVITIGVTNANTQSVSTRVITMIDRDSFTMPIAMGGPPITYTFTRVK